MNIYADLFLTFGKIGAFTFGGGYAMIPLIENQCVEKKQWFTHDEFMDMTVIAESTPGPIAINCATYVGYKRAGVIGSAVATLGVVLPSFIIILLISMFFEKIKDIEIIKRGFAGIRVAVSMLILDAGIKMIRKSVSEKKNRIINVALISAYFVIMFLLNIFGINISVIYLMLTAAFLGGVIFREKKEGLK